MGETIKQGRTWRSQAGRLAYRKRKFMAVAKHAVSKWKLAANLRADSLTVHPCSHNPDLLESNLPPPPPEDTDKLRIVEKRE